MPLVNQQLFDVSVVFDNFDRNGDGVLDRAEFEEYAIQQQQQQQQQQYVVSQQASQPHRRAAPARFADSGVPLQAFDGAFFSAPPGPSVGQGSHSQSRRSGAASPLSGGTPPPSPESHW